MTDILDPEKLTELAKHREWPTVSIHMTIHRGNDSARQNLIRYKNLLKEAQSSLRQHGMRPAEIETFLCAAKKLAEDASMWRSGDARGLAVLLGKSTNHVLRLDIEVPEAVMTGDRFLIRPLLPALDKGERFFVLALSKNRVRLLEGGRSQITEVDVAGMPKSLADALKYDDYERQVQFHSRTPGLGGGGRRAAIFHGQGSASDAEKASLSRYFRMIDQGLKEFLVDSSPPLLLAGVDYLLPIYRSVNSYPGLVELALTGNPDDTPASELHVEALDLLEPYFRAEIERDLANFESLLGTGIASNDIEVILSAACEGRIKTLFVSPDSTTYGHFDTSISRVRIEDEPSPVTQDLMNFAAIETLTRGGSIHTLKPQDSPTAAAIFRY